jgi:hypothetical protein
VTTLLVRLIILGVATLARGLTERPEGARQGTIVLPSNIAAGARDGDGVDSSGVLVVSPS